MSDGPTLVVEIYAAIGYGALAFVTGTYLYHHFVWIPRVKRELYELNRRRSGRVREALASGQNLEIAVPPAPSFPFESWVELCTDGTISSAGRTFRTSEIFQVAARDDRNILRASVTCDGSGTVVIVSHGETFVARFTNRNWDIQTSLHET